MATDFLPLITSIANKYNQRPQLVAAQAQHESTMDPFAIGDSGEALGLLQVHKDACKDVGLDWDAIHAAIIARDEYKAATLSLEAGCAYLSLMMKMLGGDERLALMAYNQGETRIRKAKAYADAVLKLVP